MKTTIENNQRPLSNLLDTMSNNHDDWKSVNDHNNVNIDKLHNDFSTVNNEEIANDQWANFDAFERNENSKSKVIY